MITEKPVARTAPSENSSRPTARSAWSGPFSGQVAVVTGSESGIGRATAIALGRQGACVVLNGRRQERLSETERELAQEGIPVISCLADVTEFAQCNRLIQTAIDTWGRIDVLVANASISMRAYFEELHPDVFRQVLDSNVYGAVYPLKSALPHLIRSRGCVTFISSISALNGMPSGSAYCAGKAALVNLAHTLRLELAHTGIQVGVVHIGFTKNDPDKRVLNAQGEPVPIAWRPPSLQKTQEEVASAIVRHIRQRRKTTILSGLGRLNSFVNRLSPALADWILLKTYDRLRNLYE